MVVRHQNLKKKHFKLTLIFSKCRNFANTNKLFQVFKIVFDKSLKQETTKLVGNAKLCGPLVSDKNIHLKNK